MSPSVLHKALGIVLTLVLLSFVPEAWAQLPRQDVWVTNGSVDAIATDGTTIYIGGAFTQIGPNVGAAAAIDEGSGGVLQPYPRVVGPVTCVAADGSGGWFLGGSFTNVQGAPRHGLARINANGNVTSWNPSPDVDVRAMVCVNGTLYVGGNLGHVFGQVRNYGAAFDVASGALTSWNPATDNYIDGMAAGTNCIYISGPFSHVGVFSRNGIASVEPAFATCQPWTSPVSGRALTVWSGRVLVGASGLYAVSEATAQTVGSISTNGSVTAAAPDPASGNIYFGGSFSTAGALARGNLAAVDSTFGLLSWSPLANRPVYDLAIGAGGVVAAGDFTGLAGQVQPHLGSLDLQSGMITTWNPRCDGDVNVVRVSNGVVFAGGTFGSINTVTRNCAAAIDPSTGMAKAWAPNPDNAVFSIVIGSATVYLGGSFSYVAGVSHTHFASVDPVSGAPTSWAVNMTESQSVSPYAMVLWGNTLYVGGTFHGGARSYLAAVDATTGAILSWNPAPDGPVYAMRLYVPSSITLPPILYIGGAFTSVAGTARSRAAAVNASTGALASWNPNVVDVRTGGTVHSLGLVATLHGGVQTVYIGGVISSIGGVSRYGAGAVDGNGAVTNWNPTITGEVDAIVPLGGQVYLGGSFTQAGVQTFHYLCAVDASLGNLTAWRPGLDGSVLSSRVKAILLFDRTVYVGGSFSSAQGLSCENFGGLLDPAVTAVDMPMSPPPSVPAMLAAPNPFRSSTAARFTLSRSENVRVAVFDALGRRVRVLENGILDAGPHSFSWDGVDSRGAQLPSGVYFLHVQTPSTELTTKVYRLR